MDLQFHIQTLFFLFLPEKCIYSSIKFHTMWKIKSFSTLKPHSASGYNCIVVRLHCTIVQPGRDHQGPKFPYKKSWQHLWQNIATWLFSQTVFMSTGHNLEHIQTNKINNFTQALVPSKQFEIYLRVLFCFSFEQLAWYTCWPKTLLKDKRLGKNDLLYQESYKK